MPSILVTGNKGYIGSHLEGDGIDIKHGNDVLFYKAKRQYEIVIHTAAKTSVVGSMENPEEYIATNVWGTLNILKQHPEAHFIYLSTASIYGEGTDHTIDSQLKPESIYASTKLAGEFLVKNLARSWCILRLTNVIGGEERGDPNVYQVFKNLETLPIYGDGLQTRDFIHVDKVCDVIRNSFDKRGLFNIGSGISKTIIDVASEFKKPMAFYPARPGELRSFGVKDAIDSHS